MLVAAAPGTMAPAPGTVFFLFSLPEGALVHAADRMDPVVGMKHER